MVIRACSADNIPNILLVAVEFLDEACGVSMKWDTRFDPNITIDTLYYGWKSDKLLSILQEHRNWIVTALQQTDFNDKM
jgi:hypothetical protein